MFTMLRKDFPFLTQKLHGVPIAYLDNAATMQKPQMVIDALTDFYISCNANIHRGAYFHAECATTQYENSRNRIAQFIGADQHEIIFVRGATEGINLVAQSWLAPQLQAGDEIIISALEHHANILPWYNLAHRAGLVVKIAPITPDGQLRAEGLINLITKRTKLVSILQVSHVTGTHVPVDDIIAYAHQQGVCVLVDAAQSVAHQPIDVKKIGADFLVFSGHKVGGPTGIGVVYVAESLQEQCQPYQWGGGMVDDVRLPDGIIPKPMPHRLEAGTPAIAQAVGLAAAVSYLQRYDWHQMRAYESMVCRHLIQSLAAMPRVHIVGPVQELMQRGYVVSFWVEGIHAHDVAHGLDLAGIAVRAGNHCAQPLIDALGGKPVVRVSFFWYNTIEEVDRLVATLLHLMDTIFTH